jgi:hypothetical protein
MTTFDPEFDSFIIDNFESEEAVMVMLVVRESDSGATPGEIQARLVAGYGADPSEQRRLAEKRIELRLRDLALSGLVERGADGRFRFDRSNDKAGLIDRLAGVFASRRTELNRLIYSPAAAARRVAEAFRL